MAPVPVVVVCVICLVGIGSVMAPAQVRIHIICHIDMISFM